MKPEEAIKKLRYSERLIMVGLEVRQESIKALKSRFLRKSQI